MPCPILPPNAKKARIPHTANARLMPARIQFHQTLTTEGCPRRIVQMSKPKAMATIINPQPNSVNTRSHNTHSKTTITATKMSLRTAGDAMALENRFDFDAGRRSLAFRLGLDLLLAFDTELCLLPGWLPLGFPNLHNNRNDDRTAMNSFMEESAQGVLHYGINETRFTEASSIMIQSS